MKKTSTGYCSTGYCSTGDYSTGYYSTGDYSTGNRSTGDCSTGNWSISNYSTGHFSTKDYDGFGAFNKPCTPEEWENAQKPEFLFFYLTEWILKKDMTGEERKDNPEYKTTGGYLKVYDYKEAWRRSFDAQGDIDEQIKQLEALPNFDYAVFVEISGIDYRNEKNDATKEAMELLKSKGYRIIKG